MKSVFRVAASGIIVCSILAGCSKPESETTSPAVLANSQSAQSQAVQPPVAKKVDHKMEIHGHQRNDVYYWMRDDQRQSPEVLAYLNDENKYTREQLAHTEDLQKKLFEEITARLEPNKESVPVFDKGFWYVTRFEKGKDYAIISRHKEKLDAVEEVLIDQNLRAEGHEYYSLGGWSVSSNQQLMAIAEDTISRRQYTIRVKNLSTGQFFDEVIENTSGQIIWANDNKTFFYVKKDPQTLLPYQVYRHQLGSPVAEDVLVYEEKDNTFYTYIFKTRSEKYIGIGLSATQSSEQQFIDADKPDSNPVVFLPREKDHEYGADHINGVFYFQSNLNALNENLLKVAEDKIGTKQDWQVVLPHRQDTLLQGFELFNSFMVINERENGVEKLRIRDYSGKLLEEIPFNDAAYSTRIDANPDPASQVVRYAYSSLTTPQSLYEFDTQTHQSRLLKQDKVLGNFHPADYQSERIMIEARDGQKVPVSLVYKKQLFKKDGTNPLLLYAYGSYGATMDPSFNISNLSLLDRGFVYAIAHIRGSKMMGRQWYDMGKKLHKMNTFTDYIDATKALVAEKYAAPDRVYARGGSAGGLLMGAVANMAPELYHGMIAAVPFVDVVTTMLDESIPLTTGEYDEWGNPNDKTYYDYMLSYSPYDQVKAQNYPNMLVITGLHDSQVQYFEPAKWVAKLRAMKTDHNKLLLDTDMEAGHGGKSGRYKRYLDVAKQYAFIMDLAGIKE